MAEETVTSIANPRLEELLSIIQSYAGLNFKKQLKITGDNETFDAIACGINMLGEELNESTISLKEKEVLLQEIHHRVKNNLQVISSLLNLQASKTDMPEFSALISSCQTRIKTMSLVHEQLYESKDFKGIDFAKYLKELCNMLKSVYSDVNNISLVVECDKIELKLPLDIAIPLGLIVTELVSNSYKHAFPKAKNGRIGVAISCIDTSGNDFKLICSDNGKGFEKENKRLASLGLELIDALSEQISAKTTQSTTKNGTITEVYLKV